MSGKKQAQQQQQAQQDVVEDATSKADFVYELFILLAIYILAFACRLFAVIRFESVIHEFDPWFNFRVTKYLVREGFYNFHNWFDDTTWYPLGRFIGGTVYPGLMWTAALIYHILNGLRITVNIRNTCVLLAPFMASNTSVATYLFAKEVWNPAAGVVAAALLCITPAYISRSVGGSYDNEAVAIFALVMTFYLWVKAVKTGSMFWAAMCALAYFYMVAAWGGYIFIINLIPFHVLSLVLAGRYSHRLYVAYCTFFVLGTIMSMTIPFVSFIPVTSPEHYGSIGVFGLLQVYAFFFYVRSMVPREHMRTLLWAALAIAVGVIGLMILAAVMGYVPFLTMRLLMLLGSTKNIAIVKSVSEHQPSPWTTFFFDLHCMTIFIPVGIYYCFRRLTDQNLFTVLYVVFASYFSSIMVRLVLVLGPGACVVAAIAISEIFSTYFGVILRQLNRHDDTKPSSPTATSPSDAAADEGSNGASDEEDDAGVGHGKKGGKRPPARPRSGAGRKSALSGGESGDDENATSALLSVVVIVGMVLILSLYVVHCTYVTSVAYSSPSVVLQARNADGSRTVFDDFREAYYWLWQNTPLDAKIMSWWDYGYQIKGMGNRTVIVDNNTRNNTHIATVGCAMASTEEDAYPILRRLDVDYVLVVFGGLIGYSSDDINKFLWMVRIGGGVFPRIVEADYFADGQYRVDSLASKTMRNCLMYKMCYYRFGEVTTAYGHPAGFDRVRGTEVGEKNIQLKYLEEAFTSEHWMVRIYRVKKEVEQLGGIIFPKITAAQKRRRAAAASSKRGAAAKSE